jgi:hypothetical protein
MKRLKLSVRCEEVEKSTEVLLRECEHCVKLSEKRIGWLITIRDTTSANTIIGDNNLAARTASWSPI